MAKTSFDEITKDTGEFKRVATSYRNVITADGSSGFKAEPNRYVLYISLACPWASRCYAVRNLKGLQKVIDLVVVEPKWGVVVQSDPPAFGWVFPKDEESAFPGSTPDRYYNFSSLRELYLKSCPSYEGKYTVPVLWDLKTESIVNNESSEIIRMLNTEFNEFAEYPERDIYPQHLREEIDHLNTWMYNTINNGVYRCGFATKQEAYETAFRELFSTLDEAEAKLQNKRFLCGDRFTEADIRLFVTLIRFDAVYYGHFKTNLRKISEYPALSAWLRDVYQIPGITETVNIPQIKNHYYGSHVRINPYLIVPLGPILDFSGPHKRESLAQKGLWED